jgi:hypothetical protein
MDLRLEAQQLALVFALERAQRRLVDAHAGALHAGENGGERHLDLAQ